MIELQHVSVGYSGKSVLRDISLSFPHGQITAILGPNGCGKSTLLKASLGLLPLQSGHIFYDGVDLRTLEPVGIARQAAYLSQGRNIPQITAERMVLHGRFPYLGFPRRYRAEDYAAVDDALRRTGSLELKHRRMDELSGGQRQKVYLSMALAQQAQTIFMDEPTTYLDISHQLEVMAIARSLADQGTAVILVLHDLSLALRTADQIVLLANGKVECTGSPEAIYLSHSLETIFGIYLSRVSTPSGWQYFCTTKKEH